MSLTQDAFDQAVEAIASAPLVGWEQALAALSRAGGGWATQLIGLGADGQYRFDLSEDIRARAIRLEQDQVA